jgi:hypothetical protein
MVVVWSRVILKFLDVVYQACGCVMGGFFGVVLGDCGVVARCSVGRGVVDWSISVVFQFNKARKSSFCVACRDCVV